MKKYMLRIGTDWKISRVEFPEDSNDTLGRTHKAIDTLDRMYKSIGNGCECIETVQPARLYSELQAYGGNLFGNDGKVVMIVDEEGYFNKQPFNPVSSYLYRMDEHGGRIMGAALLAMIIQEDIVGWDEDDPELIKLERKLTHLSRELLAFHRMEEQERQTRAHIYETKCENGQEVTHGICCSCHSKVSDKQIYCSNCGRKIFEWT